MTISYLSKIILISLLATLIMSCGNNQNDATTSPNTPPETMAVGIGMDNMNMEGMESMENQVKIETAADDISAIRMTEQGIFQVSIQTDVTPIPINQIQSWTLHLQNAAGESVDNAEITLVGGMPMHNHGMPTVPQVTQALGNGSYLVEGLQFQMPGQWLVTLTISADDKTDNIIYNLMLQP
ncbi:MAG: FixH family protein [Gammaproteobacteria bacterium]